MEEISNLNIEIRPSFDKYLLKIVLGYEETVEHKLNILILGPTHYNLGIALADYGHKITFITWDIDDHKNLKVLIKKSKFDSQISNQLINLKAFESLTETKYDVLLSLTSFYRLLTDLNFDKQEVFFEYVLKNIDSAIWLLPKNDERNPLDIYLPNQRELDFYVNYDYVAELASVKINFNSAEYPILYTSNVLLFIDSKFYKNTFVNVIHNSGSVFSRVYFVKNKLYKVTFSNSNGDSSAAKEFKFLSNFRLMNKIKLRTPIKVSLNKGLIFDISKRKKINGIDLSEIKTIGDSHKILKEFIQLCRKFSKAKIYHNDMRPWNILWNGKKCVFIDFEYSSKYDQDSSNYPQILYFFAMANYIKKLDQLKIWDIEDIIQQNSEYLHSNEAHKLFYTSWEKISAVSLSELLKIDYFDVKKGFKQLIELLESY
jgi:predicted Ser/Thr protein kinase